MASSLTVFWALFFGTAVVLILIFAFVFSIAISRYNLNKERDFRASILNATGALIVVLDRTGNIYQFNRACENLTGFSLKDVQGIKLNTLPFISQGSEFKLNLFDQPANEQKVLIEENCWLGKEGEKHLIAWSATCLRDKLNAIQWMIFTGIDITEKRAIEDELITARKLESIGILAGGIAHDFNNILTAILGNISLAKIYLRFEDELFEILTKAEKASLQAKNLTKQLLTFSKGGAPVIKTSSITDVIVDTAQFALRGSNVRCDLRIDKNLWPVDADEGQISQVINNLVINADQAMPTGGVIEIHGENITIDHINQLQLEKGNFIKISVKDRGVGIPKEMLDKIFDPYFTTKPQGNGLGLATSFSIIKNHRGYLTVDSKIGIGTTFTIYLPASKQQYTSTVEKKNHVFNGKGKILVLDDEEIIRDVVHRMLTYLGFDVELAKDGVEAIECYERAMNSDKPFDAVIMDLTIPGGMGGKEAIECLHQLDPNVCALVSSGYSTDPIMADFKKYGFKGVVCKPYKLDELSEALLSVIN
ncbi:ATP-binding protein [candidate division KSB1 bacterium]|nr:ATP-binding protein [candidate division KSB1 bacterium]